VVRYRRQLGKWINRTVGGFETASPVEAAGDYEKVANIFWLVCLVSAIVASVVVYKVSDPVTAQKIDACIWGIFIGGTFLLYLPQKLLITMAGGTIGSLLSNFSDVSEKLKNLGASAKDINSTLNDIFGSEFNLQNGTVVIFIGIVLLCLLPAYRGQGD